MAEPVRKMPADTESEPDWRMEEGDPFPFGYRWRRVRLANGEETDEQVALTPEDVLDPQFGDEVPQTEPHFKLITLLGELLLRRYEAREDVLILGDVKIYWGVRGLPNPAPDLAFIEGVRNPKKGRRVFRVSKEGVRPSLVIEVVSDSNAEMRRNDYERKVEIYEKVRIPEYLIFDEPSTETGRLRITGYRLDSRGRYRPIEPDARGRFLSETTGLLFGVAEDERMLVILEAATGEPVRTGLQEAQDRKAAEAARKEAEERARAAEAELARLRAFAE
jgi:Uma2 family endonuclease